MLSQKAKYALRAILMLAEYSNRDDLLAISDIAKREGIPRKFLEAILVELRDRRLLESRRGRRGGYRLAKSPHTITFGEVIRIIDGPLALIGCASRSRFEPCDDCTDTETCSIRWVMLKARDAIAQTLDGYTLAEAVRQHRDENVVPINFSI
jgi:Rrf2 family protein